MARHKKTRQQKITAEERKRQRSTESSFTYVDKEITPTVTHSVSSDTLQQKTSSGIISIADYRYLTQDLKKITIVTAAIIVIQLILHFVVKI